MKYFTSDTHFGGNLILKREYRRFNNWKEYIDFQLNLFRTQVLEDNNKDNEFYILGDLIESRSPLYKGVDKEYLKRLITMFLGTVPADLNLILGNNEERLINLLFENNLDYFREFCISLGVKSVERNKEIQLDGGKIIYLTHYPSDRHKSLFSLFGHVHRASGIHKPHGCNVCVDLWHYQAVSENMLLRHLYEKPLFYDNNDDVLIMGAPRF